MGLKNMKENLDKKTFLYLIIIGSLILIIAFISFGQQGVEDSGESQIDVDLLDRCEGVATKVIIKSMNKECRKRGLNHPCNLPLTLLSSLEEGYQFMYDECHAEFGAENTSPKEVEFIYE